MADARGGLTRRSVSDWLEETQSKVAESVRRWDLAEPTHRILVALSGGADSTALALLLTGLGYEVVLGHVDHGLRPDSEGDVSHCGKFAARLGLPILVERVEVDPPTEAKARLLRYDALERMSRESGCQRIATGHTMDDQAETVVFRLGRGGFPMGIRHRRGKIIRPLLELRRAETERVCREHGVDFLVDPTNVDERFARNRIRHRVMPVLQEWVPALANLALVSERRARAVRSQVDRAVAAGFVRPNSPEPAVDREWLLQKPAVVRRQVLRRLLNETGADASSRLVTDIDTKVVGNRVRLALPNGWEAVAVGDEIRMRHGDAEPPVTLPEVQVKIPGRTVSPEWKLEIKTEILDAPAQPVPAQGEVVLDADEIRSSLGFRQRRAGDRFKPAGMEGSKKLQDFFVDLKVRRDQRDRIPIFVSGGVIASVGTLRTDERFGAKDSSSRILRLSVFPFLSEG